MIGVALNQIPGSPGSPGASGNPVDRGAPRRENFQIRRTDENAPNPCRSKTLEALSKYTNEDSDSPEAKPIANRFSLQDVSNNVNTLNTFDKNDMTRNLFG